MARDFPPITDVSSAVRFAVEAELAGADFAAAAEILAPDEHWREKLEELTCAHDDRRQKLQAHAADLAGAGGGLSGLAGEPFARVLGQEPAATWPEAATQMAEVEETIAACHEALVAAAGDVLGDRARLFAKAAAQARAAAAELRAMPA